jgi:hypothetical protein
VAVWKTYVWSGTETTGRTRVALVIVAPLIYRKCLRPTPRANRTIIASKRKGGSMMDVLMIALALGLFTLAIGYAHAIDRG